jgi:hypothetical protein
LATYESQKEADFMKGLFTRSGEVENTTFAILSPDGKKKLTRAGRAPFYEYRDARAMASGMKKIAQQYKVTDDDALSDEKLPFARTLDLGLNIASADALPLIVVAGQNEKQIQTLERKFAPIAWAESNAGQFGYAKVTDADSLKPITGIAGDLKNLNAILVVAPGQFGLSGKVLAQFDADSDTEAMKTKIADVLEKFERIEKSHGSHVQLGIELGIDWESAIPETDAEAVRARKRARGN